MCEGVYSKSSVGALVRYCRTGKFIFSCPYSVKKYASAAACPNHRRSSLVFFVVVSLCVNRLLGSYWRGLVIHHTDAQTRCVPHGAVDGRGAKSIQPITMNMKGAYKCNFTANQQTWATQFSRFEFEARSGQLLFEPPFVVL